MCISPTLDSNAFRVFGTSPQLPVAYCNFTAAQWQPSVQHMEDGELEQPKSTRVGVKCSKVNI